MMWKSTKKVFWILMFWYSFTAIVSSLASLVFAEFNYYVLAVLLIGLSGMYMFYFTQLRRR